MGSKQSSDDQNREGRPIETDRNYMSQTKRNNDSEFFIKDTQSSYKGVFSVVKSEPKNENLDETPESINKEINNRGKEEKDPNFVSTTFIWGEDATVVYLTGSFANWNNRFLMPKVGNQFVLKIVIFILI